MLRLRLLATFWLTCSISAAGVLLSGGCTTISGHKVVTGTDGRTSTIPVKGLPILVKRATKAMFFVTESTYTVRTIVDNAGRAELVDPRDEVEVKISEQPVLLGPTEIYTIDPKRPAFGTLNYTINMTDGVVTSIDGKVDDKTLGEVRAFLKDILDKFVPTPTGGVQKQAGEATDRRLKSQVVKLVTVDLLTGAITVQQP